METNINNTPPAADASSTNTVLIVILLLIVVGLGVWYFTTHRQVTQPAPASPGVNVQLNMPTNDNTTPPPSSGTGGPNTY